MKIALRLFGPSALLFLACSSGTSSSSSPASPDTENEPPPVAPSDGGANALPDGAASSDGGTTPNEDADAPGEEIEPGPPAISYIGRFDTTDPAGPKCSWPGCRIVARFQGTQVSVRLKEYVDSWMLGGPSEWDVAIDGVWQPKIVTTANAEKAVVIAQGLPAGVHKVELYKRSEAQNGTTQFLGYDFGSGVMLAPPKHKARRIEIVGDSQPAAFGVEGVGLGPDCPGEDHAATYQNFRRSFGAKLGTTFDAEVYGTVFSGKGFAKNIWRPDTETMPIVFTRINPLNPQSSWAFGWAPNVVVLMMGANDFDVGQPVDDGQATVEEYNAAFSGFVTTLRTKYPDAYVLLAVSPSISDAKPPGRNLRTNVKAAMTTAASKGDPKIWMFEPGLATEAELTGCNGHGNPQFHDRVATEIAAQIKTKLGW